MRTDESPPLVTDESKEQNESGITHLAQHTLSNIANNTGPVISPSTLRSVLSHIQTLKLPNQQVVLLLQNLLANRPDNAFIPSTLILEDSDLQNILLNHEMTSLSFSKLPATHWDSDFQTLQWKCAILGHSAQSFARSIRLLTASAVASLPFVRRNPDEYAFQMEARLKLFIPGDWLITRYVQAIVNSTCSPKIRPRTPLFSTPSWCGQKGKSKINLPVVDVRSIQHVGGHFLNGSRMAIIATEHSLCALSERVRGKEEQQALQPTKKKEYTIKTVIPDIIHRITRMAMISDGSIVAISLAGKLHIIFDVIHQDLISTVTTSSTVVDTMLEIHHQGLLSFTFVCKSGLVESWEIESRGDEKGKKSRVESSKIPMDCNSILSTAVIVRSKEHNALWVMTGDGMGYVGIASVNTEEFICNLMSIGFQPLRAYPVRSCYVYEDEDTSDDTDSNYTLEEIKRERQRCTVAWVGQNKMVAVTRIQDGEIKIIFKMPFPHGITHIAFTSDGKTICVSLQDGSVRLYDIECHNNTPPTRLVLPGEDTDLGNSSGKLVTMYGSDMVLAIGKNDGRLRICDAGEYSVCNRRHTGSILSVTIVENQKDKIIVSSCTDGMLMGWKVATNEIGDGKVLWMLSNAHESGIKHIESWAFGMMSSIGLDGEVATWVVKRNGIELLQRVKPSITTRSFIENNDVRTVALANSGGSSSDGKEKGEGATMVTPSNQQPTHPPAVLKRSGTEEGINVDDWVKSFELFYVSKREESIAKNRIRCQSSKIIDNENGKVLGTLPAKMAKPHAWCFSSDGSLLVVGLDDGNVSWFDIEI